MLLPVLYRLAVWPSLPESSPPRRARWQSAPRLAPLCSKTRERLPLPQPDDGVASLASLRRYPRRFSFPRRSFSSRSPIRFSMPRSVGW
jgi:hypothetical protein